MLPATAGAQTNFGIWGRQILPQPFDELRTAQPFHEIEIPAWVQETIGCGYALSVMDSQAIVVAELEPASREAAP